MAHVAPRGIVPGPQEPRTLSSKVRSCEGCPAGPREVVSRAASGQGLWSKGSGRLTAGGQLRPAWLRRARRLKGGRGKGDRGALLHQGGHSALCFLLPPLTRQPGEENQEEKSCCQQTSMRAAQVSALGVGGHPCPHRLPPSTAGVTPQPPALVGRRKSSFLREDCGHCLCFNFQKQGKCTKWGGGGAREGGARAGRCDPVFPSLPTSPRSSRPPSRRLRCVNKAFIVWGRCEIGLESLPSWAPEPAGASAGSRKHAPASHTPAATESQQPKVEPTQCKSGDGRPLLGRCPQPVCVQTRPVWVREAFFGNKTMRGRWGRQSLPGVCPVLFQPPRPPRPAVLC